MLWSPLIAIQDYNTEYNSVSPPHYLTSPPSSSSLSFSLPSCPIIIFPKECVSQTFCRPTEVCQWQITLIKDNPKYSLWASSQFEASVCHVEANEKGREVRGVQRSGNPLPYGHLNHYTNAHPHTHSYSKNHLQVCSLIFFCLGDSAYKPKGSFFYAHAVD